MKRFPAILLLPASVLLFACGQAKKPVAPNTESVPPPVAEATDASGAPALGNNGQGRPPGGPGGPGGGQNRQMRSPEERVKDMQTLLGLSQDQSDQILAIFKEQRPAMEALRDNQALSREDRRAQSMALRQQNDEKIAAILTPEQKAKWEQEREQRRAQMGNREGGPGGGPKGGAGGGQTPAGGG